MRNQNLKVVISGGPGSGKTTVIEILKKMGYFCYDELSRSIIKEGKSKGLENYFLSHPKAFSEAIFEGRKKHFEQADQIDRIEKNPYIFFDRGIHDVFAYLDALGESDTLWKKKVLAYSYDLVFLLPPWEAIYTQDEERMENYEQAAYFYTYIESIYKETNIPILIIPEGSPSERTAFIIKHLSAYD